MKNRVTFNKNSIKGKVNIRYIKKKKNMKDCICVFELQRIFG